MAVLSEYQNRGLGERLKRAQRERVLAQGLSFVRWTFDPLEVRNAHLNFVKLGGFARAYAVDLYGPVSGHLNEGLPTDRFEVEWHIRSRRVADALAGRHVAAPDRTPVATPALLTRASCRADGRPEPEGWRPPPDGAARGVWYVEAPADIQGLKHGDAALALAWRLLLREAFQRLFARGFAASGVARFGDGARAAYRVEPVADLDLADA